MQRWARGAWDVALAAACVQLAVLLTVETGRGLGPTLARPAVVLAGAHAAAVVVRRRWPQAAAGWLVATAVVYRLLGLPPAFLGPAGLVGLYTVSARTPRSGSLRWLVASLAVALSAAPLLTWDSVGMHAALVGGAWFLGDQVRRRQEEASAHADRAQQLERAQEELARSAVVQERLRIARELHDVVAHSMSVVALNAGAGRLVAWSDPAAAEEALATIEVASRGALSEMRQMLTVLRRGEPSESLAPLPGLADLPQLVTTVADAGLTVDVRIDGPQRPLPRGVDLAAYRIVQEALTNTLRHSRAASSSVALRYDDAHLTVRVVDPGPPAAPGHAAGADAGSGSGLIGMRERVALYAGALRAQRTDQGGFLVEACLPTMEQPQ